VCRSRLAASSLATILYFAFYLPLLQSGVWKPRAVVGLTFVASCQTFGPRIAQPSTELAMGHIVYVADGRDQGPVIGRVSMAMYSVAVAFVALRYAPIFAMSMCRLADE
jgi:hypothetical protein